VSAPPLVLASGSPRRIALLATAGIACEALAADVDEDGATARALARATAPSGIAIELAAMKARAVAALRPGARVLGADTLVVLDGTLLGKPRDRAEAWSMLSRLAGRSHEVITGLALLAPDGTLATAFESTAVTFARWPASARAAYVDSGDAFDKAGAYGIQGPPGAFVERVDGDYFNIMGLPLARVLKLLG
jgi:septum formation protein